MTDGPGNYKVKITAAVLKVCQSKLNPSLIALHEKLISSRPAIYHFWRSDIKAFNIDKGSYTWSADDIYHAEILSEIKMALCSGIAFSGQITQNPFNFKNYGVNFVKVMVLTEFQCLHRL